MLYFILANAELRPTLFASTHWVSHLKRKSRLIHLYPCTGGQAGGCDHGAADSVGERGGTLPPSLRKFRQQRRQDRESGRPRRAELDPPLVSVPSLADWPCPLVISNYARLSKYQPPLSRFVCKKKDDRKGIENKASFRHLLALHSTLFRLMGCYACSLNPSSSK